MAVVAFASPSKSGKTAMICALIRHFRQRGRTVAAIKHTHHPLNEERRGDTGSFADSGASTVILAGEGEAVVFGSEVRWVAFQSPRDLLAWAAADIVLVEGFKDFDGWPHAASVEEAMVILSRGTAPARR